MVGHTEVHEVFTGFCIAVFSDRDESRVHAHSLIRKELVMNDSGTLDEDDFDDPSWYNTD
jgi:hypothetical protein